MKKLIIIIILSFSYFNIGFSLNKNFTFPIQKENKKKEYYEPSKENKKFLTQLADFESTNNYKASRGNYIGKYQIHLITLKEIGYNINPDSFRVNPEIFNEYKQEEAIRDLIKYHRKILIQEIRKKENQIINVKIDSSYKEIKITESGVLAAAHLGGVKSALDLLQSNGELNYKDGYGTPISFYLEKFSLYKVDF